MKSPVLGLAIATVAFGGSSVYLWQQLDQERTRAAQVEQRAAELDARIAELEKARNHLAERRMAGADNFIAGSFGNGAAAAPPPPPAGDKTESAKGEAQPVWTQTRPDRSPAFRKMMRSQIRANNKRVYADVGPKLGLDKDTANKLIDLITDQQIPDFGNVRDMNDQGEVQRYFEEKQRQNQAQIAELIGADKAVSLQEYQESIPARMEVEMLARQLEGNDTALSAEQRQKLVDAYVTERKRVPMPDSYEGIDPEAYQKSVVAWQDDYNKRTAEEASRILDSDQLTAFNEMQQWQKEMRDNMPVVPPGAVPRMRRGMVGGNAVMFSTTAPVAVSASGSVAVAAPAQEQKKP
jgi:DNA-binding transcriptional MerR regulator